MIRVWYDQEGNFLEVVFEQAPATLEELEEDVSLRRTPDGRVVGFAVINFSKHNPGGPRVPLEVWAQSAVGASAVFSKNGENRSASDDPFGRGVMVVWVIHTAEQPKVVHSGYSLPQTGIIRRGAYRTVSCH